MSTSHIDTIHICDVIFEAYRGPIAVCHSGGADSGILLYMVMRYCSGPITVYTCASKLKHYTTAPTAHNVILKCMELNNRHDITHITNFTEIQTFETLFTPISEQIKRHDYTIVYTGVTALPPKEVTDTFINETPLVDRRDPLVIRPLYKGKFYSPLINKDKSIIYKLYEYYNLLDTLYPLTRSCESLTLSTGHCGVCWWCEERKWAFGKLSDLSEKPSPLRWGM